MNIKTTWLSKLSRPADYKKKSEATFLRKCPWIFFEAHVTILHTELRFYYCISNRTEETTICKWTQNLFTHTSSTRQGWRRIFLWSAKKKIDALFCSGIRAKVYVEKRACKTIFLSTQVTYRILEPKPVVGIKHTITKASDTLKSSKKLKSFYSQSFFTSFCHSNSK